MSLWIAACGGGIASTTPTPPANGVTSVTVTPNPETAIIGTQVQFTATVAGTGSFSTAATWSVATSDGSGNDPGDIGTTGLYTTPYPAPATVTVTATSTENTNVSGNATITLNPPAALTNTNALTVNVSSPGNPISPLIYGMAAWVLDPINSNPTIADAFLPANISIMRWGGDSTERYNYQLDVTSQASANYFKNLAGTGGDDWTPVSGVSAFDEMVTYNAANGIETVGTVPVQGWVAKDSTSCSFPTSTYPNQTEVSGTCGNGIEPNGASEGSGPTCTSSAGCDITGNDPTLASISAPPPTPADPIGPSWTGDWVTYLVNKFGPGISGNSVAIYQLDNEPKGWVGFDRDVHPNPFTYDELTNGGIGTALAIKTADPTVLVSGPVQDYWQSYFYSGADIADGATAGPCDQFWSNPLDREAHGGVALIPYYLEQFAAAETTYGKRLLDYVDLHTYFAAEYPASSGTSVDLNYDANEDASNTAAQAARLNSTRVFWDPTYTDSSNRYPQPNYFTDPNYTTSCTLPQQAPEVIPMMRNWVAAELPRHQAGHFRIQLGRTGSSQRRACGGRHSGHLWTRRPRLGLILA